MVAVKKQTRKTNKAQIKKIQVPISDEEKIFGAEAKTIVKTIIDYESPEINYKVTNLRLKNKPMIINGTFVETFIGSSNLNARDALKEGAKSVITYDVNKEKEYKIEVIK